ncbi:site-2 protease family protein [Aphanothece hegewaldii CCALA 016]|uniref:Zinc metalloprotease n=1 Tax=Aphanothece hegewaldii CCALA 016 TaxID=2107694 RepID=A0A2T1LWK4_9CHRO|nr:site-2 protease family protein [Aphanothece hegewaldii]PSF36287.1 site-2 protease family protein [Aphanothece hegewaldii CCALA 016]
MRSSWRIGTLFGIPLYIDASWLLILVFVTLINAGNVTATGLTHDNWFLGGFFGFLLALLLFVSVLLHELGHSLVARAQGINVKSITLFLFGGLASIEKESQQPLGALSVAIAGPLVSLSLFVLFSALSQFWSSSTIIGFLTEDLANLNLVLAIFNLIPGLPLDGGQILKALVWKATGDRLMGMRWASASGQILGWLGMILGGLVVIIVGDVGGLWVSFIGWFILRNATAYERLTVLQESLLDLTASDAMSHDFRVVNAHLSIQEFIETYLLSGLATPMVYYAASDGRYRGMIEQNEVQEIERSQWSSKTLSEIVHPLTVIPSVTEKTPLVSVIKALEASKERYLTVLSPAGAVSGVIDRGDLVKAIAQKQNIPITEAQIKQIKNEGTYPTYLQLSAIAQSLEN